MSNLTPQQETFVTYYVLAGCANATEAALKANYSPANAGQQASRLLKKANIQQAIEQKQTALAVQSNYSTAQWLTDQLTFQQEARDAGAWGAVGKFSEMLGRHIGALRNDRMLSRDEAEVFTFLGEAMANAKHARAELETERSRGQLIEGASARETASGADGAAG